MFSQVRMPKEHFEFLRFLWFPNSDLYEKPVPYRLKVHVFGAKSSPSCASHALRKSAELSAYPKEVIEVVLRSFYVEDVLKSEVSVKSTVELAKNLISLLESNGFDLTSFMSNSCKLLSSLPINKLSKDLKELNLTTDDLPEEKTLGLVWKPDRDCVSCCLKVEEHPCTKRDILKTLFSIYDPLFLIPGKKIFQRACAIKLDCDEDLPEELSRR